MITHSCYAPTSVSMCELQFVPKAFTHALSWSFCFMFSRIHVEHMDPCASKRLSPEARIQHLLPQFKTALTSFDLKAMKAA